MANISNINDFFVVDSAGLKAVVGADLANGNGSPYVGTDFTVVGRDASSPVANLWLSNFTHKSYILISDNSSNFIIRDSAAGNRLTIDTDGNSTFAGTIQTTGANLFYLGKGVYTKATNASNDVDATNIWGYGLYEGAAILGELSTIRDGTVTLNLGTTYTTGKVVIRTDNKVTALTIDSSQNSNFVGNVGIGGVPSVNLEVNKSGARLKLTDGTNQVNMGLWDGANYRFEGDANRPMYFTSYQGNIKFGISGATTMTVQNGGVGIGANSPQSKLALNTNVANPGSMLEINNRGDLTPGSWSAIRFGLDSNTYPGQYGKGGIIYESRDGYNRGKLHLAVDMTADTGSIVLTDSILTVDGTTGTVGIGTTTPGSYDGEGDNLVVYDAVTPGITIALPQTTAAGSARGSILFSDGTSGSEKYRGGVIYDHGTGMGGVADTMYLRAAVNSYLALNALGHVGIGTKQPAYKLQVSGVQNANDIVINNTTTGVNLRMSSIDAYAAVFTTGAKFLALGTNNSQHLWISDGGNVGVGTGTFDGNERQLKIAEMSSGVVGDIFDASKNPNAGRLIICGQNYSPMLSMRHYSASYGFDIWVDVVSTWDAYFDVRQQTSGFRWRGYTSNDGGEVPLMHLDRYGNLVIKAALTQNGSPSDRKLKENIKPIEKALDKVSKLKGVSFDWKESDSYSKVKEDYGFIAQDVKKIVPELVREDGGGMLSLQYNGITPIIIEAIKEQQKMIQELKAEIEILKNK